MAPVVGKRDQEPGIKHDCGEGTPVVSASLQVLPTFSNNFSLGGRTATPLTPMTWVGHVTQVSSLLSELCASVERLENKRSSFCTIQRWF